MVRPPEEHFLMSDLPKDSEKHVSSGQKLPESAHTPHTFCVPVPVNFEQDSLKADEIFIANEAKESFSELRFEDSNGPKGKTEFIPKGSLLGRYRIGSMLGQGGFGAVYLAEDEELHRTVAIKVLYPDRTASRRRGNARFLKEARLLAGSDHPHIVPIYDVGYVDKSTPYIVSKYIPGCTLGQRIWRSRPSIVESAKLIAPLAEVLAYAHDHQVVHRDIKPGNIVLENGEKPYLIDFGLAERESNMTLMRRVVRHADLHESRTSHRARIIWWTVARTFTVWVWSFTNCWSASCRTRTTD